MQINTSSRLPIQDDKKVICSTCRIQFDNVFDYKMHISQEYHVYNTKRRVANLEPISEEIFEEKKAVLAQQSQCQTQLSEIIYKCQPCKKTFKTTEQLEQHKKSKNHKKSEKAYMEANPEAAHSSMFQNITTDKPLMNSVLSLLNQHSASQSEKDENDSQHEHSDSCDHPHSPEGDDDSKLPVKTSLDSLRICLFCNKELSGVKKCLDHMRDKHSFYVLDVDCVTSLKGLLTYIAERVQLGYLCLFCSKMFRNARRCQQHMMDKAHCFMNVDDEHEYSQYYDFSKTYDSHPDAEQVKRPLITKKVATPSTPGEEDKAPQNEWEDVDMEDDGDEVDVIQSDEEDDEEVKEEAKSDSGAFSIITDTKEGSSSAQFQNITDSAKNTSKNIDNDAHIIGEDSLSSIKGGSETTKKKGMTREEAILGLKIKPAQLLETGEVLLGNGRIIGTRALKYVYKQRFRFPDQREAVVVNKLAMEYRKIQAITNGIIDSDADLKNKGRISQEVIRANVLKWKRAIANDLRVEMRKNKTISRPAI